MTTMDLTIFIVPKEIERFQI